MTNPYSCPECGHTDLVVYAETGFNLDGETGELDLSKFDPFYVYWDGDSSARCIDCDYEGRAKEFQVWAAE